MDGEVPDNIRTEQSVAQNTTEVGAHDIEISSRSNPVSSDGGPAQYIPPYDVNQQPWDTHGQVPQTTIVSKSDAILRTEIDFVLVTATERELKAVLHLLKPLEGELTIWEVARRGVYYIGRFGVHVIAVAWCVTMGDGQAGAAGRTTMRAVENWNPYAVIMVGIAFGRDSNNQSIGDVLVSEQVAYYESYAIRQNGQREQRGPIVPCNEMLLGKFKAAALHWSFERPDGYMCKAQFGQLLSGPVLVDNKRFKDRLFKLYPTAVGGEMEVFGVSEAARELRTDWIAVKAICDWADGNKDNRHQELAAAAAASLAYFTLNKPTATDGLKRAKRKRSPSLGPRRKQSVEAGASLQIGVPLHIPTRIWSPNLGPAALLRADFRVVPFCGRETEMDDLMEWANVPVPFAARFYYGPGGVGKTRLGIEACLKLESDQWITGFAQLETVEDVGRLLTVNSHRDKFLVIDYVENRRELAQRLIQDAVALGTGHRIRIVLLARLDYGYWWLKMAHSPGLKDHFRHSQTVQLGSLTSSPSDRRKRFDEALEAFSTALQCPLPNPIADLDVDLHKGNILHLHMAALMALQEPARDGRFDNEAIFRSTLDRERAFWANLVEARGLNERLIEGVEIALADVTRIGGVASQLEAINRLEAMSFFRGQTGEVLHTMAHLLHDSYGGGNKWIEPLQPDLFGSYLLKTVHKEYGLKSSEE